MAPRKAEVLRPGGCWPPDKWKLSIRFNAPLVIFPFFQGNTEHMLYVRYGAKGSNRVQALNTGIML